MEKDRSKVAFWKDILYFLSAPKQLRHQSSSGVWPQLSKVQLEVVEIILEKNFKAFSMCVLYTWYTFILRLEVLRKIINRTSDSTHALFDQCK